MDHQAAPNKGSRHWLGLLVLPWIAMVWIPSYNTLDPVLLGFPFFYWYPFLWVLIGAVITAVVYLKTKDLHAGGGQQ